MTYQAALAFLEGLSDRPEIQPDRTTASTYEQLAQHATKLGFACTAQELNQVFRHAYNIHHAAWRKGRL